MAKVVYNACYGGFALSREAVLLGRQKSGDQTWGRHDIARTDETLVSVVEELGDDANGECAKLQIEEIDTGQKYRIDEYDGFEIVMTRDDYDWETAP